MYEAEQLAAEAFFVLLVSLWWYFQFPDNLTPDPMFMW